MTQAIEADPTGSKQCVVDTALPVLPSSDLERTRSFYGYFGFEEIASSISGSWLRLVLDGVELHFYESAVDWSAPEFRLAERICLIRVADAAAWHQRFANTRMRWKAFGGPSLTSLQVGAWGVPAFSVTDKDGNFIWVVEGAGG